MDNTSLSGNQGVSMSSDSQAIANKSHVSAQDIPTSNDAQLPNIIPTGQQYPQASNQHNLSSDVQQQQQASSDASQNNLIQHAQTSAVTSQQYIHTSAPQQQKRSSTNTHAEHSSQPHVVTMPIKPLLENDPPTELSKDPNMPNSTPNLTSSSSPQKAVITKVKLSDELNIFDWFRTTDIINQIAEKAKNSVDSVITTLDPGMKEYLYSGGNVNIMVISDSNCLISPIRDAFQSVFGRATVVPARCRSSDTSSDYPIKLACGFEQTVTTAKEKIKKLRSDTNSVPQNQVIAIVQPGLVNAGNESPKAYNGAERVGGIAAMPRWFLTYCMLIEDPVLNLSIQAYSQLIPLHDDIIAQASKESIYPNDFSYRHLGYTVSIDHLMSIKLQLNEAEGTDDEYGCAWLPKWAGNYETQLVHQLGLSLANAYRREWNDCVQIETIS